MKMNVIIFLIVLCIILVGCNRSSNEKNISTEQNCSLSLLGNNIESMKECLEKGANIDEVLINSFPKQLKNPLYEALDEHDFTVMQFLLEQGADPNYVDRYDNTLLMYTVGARKGNLLQEHMIDPEFTKLLIKYNANVNATRKDGYTVLDFAIENGNKDMVELLINNGANVTLNTFKCLKGRYNKLKIDDYGIQKTTIEHLINSGYSIELDPILEAAILGDSQRVIQLIGNGELNAEHNNEIFFNSAAFCSTDCLKKLIELGFNITAKDSGENSILTIAAAYGNMDVFKYLYEQQENFTDIDKGNAFNAAVYNNHTEVVEFLMSQGLDPQDQYVKYYNLPLELAAKNGDIDMIKLLMSNSNSVSDMELFYVLDIAIHKHNNEVLKFFLDNGINPDLSDKTSSLLNKACRYRNIEAVELLIKYGANPNGTKIKGDVLETAVEIGETDIVKILISNGADVNMIVEYEDGSGYQSPLFIACYYGYFDIIKLLVDNGADIEYYTESKGDISPLVIVAGKSNNILKYLLGKKVNINYQDEKGRTALMNAVQSSHSENVELLLDYGANTDLRNEEGLRAIDIAKNNKLDDIIKILEQR